MKFTFTKLVCFLGLLVFIWVLRHEFSPEFEIKRITRYESAPYAVETLHPTDEIYINQNHNKVRVTRITQVLTKDGKWIARISLASGKEYFSDNNFAPYKFVDYENYDSGKRLTIDYTENYSVCKQIFLKDGRKQTDRYSANDINIKEFYYSELRKLMDALTWARWTELLAIDN